MREASAFGAERPRILGQDSPLRASSPQPHRESYWRGPLRDPNGIEKVRKSSNYDLGTFLVYPQLVRLSQVMSIREKRILAKVPADVS